MTAAAIPTVNPSVIAWALRDSGYEPEQGSISMNTITGIMTNKASV